MDIMGWSQPMMVMRYQDVIDELKIEAAQRIGSLLYEPTAAPPR